MNKTLILNGILILRLAAATVASYTHGGVRNNMSPSQPSLLDLSPYLGLLLLKADDAENDEEFARRLFKHIDDQIPKGAVKESSTLVRKVTFNVKRSKGDFPWIGGFIYEKSGKAAWWQNAPIEWTHHLILVAAKGSFGAVCTSDAALRDCFVPPEFSQVRQAEMSKAFIGADASTVWLNGIHSPNQAKPDAKMLTGQALEFAIDPLSDQTYYLSALRSRPEIEGLSALSPSSSMTGASKKKAARLSIGVAPKRSWIWLGGTKDWRQFEYRLDAVLNHLSAAPDQAPTSFRNLAQEVISGVTFKDAYAIAFMPPELLNEDNLADEETLRLGRRLVDEIEIDLTPKSAGSFSATALIEGQQLADLNFEILNNNGSLKPSLTVVPCKAKAVNSMSDRNEAKALVKVLTRMAREGDFKVYFESPVTVVGSRIYKTTFVDRSFIWTPADFTGFNIHSEKPWIYNPNQPGTFNAKGKRQADRSLVDAILAEDDNSLFDWIRLTYQYGHLLCDDGSMEVADFIHLADDHTLTFIHAKAAGGKSRKAGNAIEVSVSDFEVVTAQAIKNLRYIDSLVLAERIKGRASRPMDRAIWLNGESAHKRGISPADAKMSFLTALKKRPAGSKAQIIILQPRISASELKYCEKHPKSVRNARMQQLNALMLTTEHVMRSHSAVFIAYSDSSR